MIKINNSLYYSNYDLIQKQNYVFPNEYDNFFDSVRVYSKDTTSSEKPVHVELKKFFLFWLFAECFPRLKAEVLLSYNVDSKSKEDTQKSNQNYIFEVESCSPQIIQEVMYVLYLESLNKNFLSNSFYFIGKNIFKLSVPVKDLLSIEELAKLCRFESSNYFFVFEFRCTNKKSIEEDVIGLFPFWNIISKSKRVRKNII